MFLALLHIAGFPNKLRVPFERASYIYAYMYMYNQKHLAFEFLFLKSDATRFNENRVANPNLIFPRPDFQARTFICGVGEGFWGSVRTHNNYAKTGNDDARHT